ncbi:RadC family protein [Actomonas aquatica]|uniref:DNA repair protein RadC n=1 Tax=Actomonas aquatica TaxID=2866162 RepID=A0ABZ1C901_9BACT|nr:DNA repair protein RadC [Opitutus sp. WL0086]WRQ88069.1 DNA repair protein RadC [Opitutus sp. WL0086]
MNATTADTLPYSRLRDMAVTERPQERLQRSGPTALSDSELLAMLLRSGTQGHDVLAVADKLLATAGSLSDLLSWTQNDFLRLRGIGKVKALQLVTVMELARRVLAASGSTTPQLTTPAEIANYCRPHTLGLAVEKFWVLCLNRKNRLLRKIEVTSGTATATLVHPREVFRAAIKEAASAVVCVHNHPSGDPAPSAADVRITRQLREAANIVEIDLLDHVVVGTPAADPIGLGFYSFRDAGVL